MKKNLSLFLMTKKGYEVLKTICEMSPSSISCVVSSKDSNVLKDYYREIKELCFAHNVKFYDRKDHYRINTAYVLAVSWRWLIDAGGSTLIVCHDSLLPKYRGFNPLVSALINGETRIGVSAILGCREFDKGPLIAQSWTRISYPIKIAEAIDIVGLNCRKIARKLMVQMAGNKTLSGKDQNEKEASYSLWRDEEDYQIDWSKSSAEIKRFIDAVGFPYKGAFSRIDGRMVRILDADLIADVRIENRTPGKVLFVLGSQPVVVCGKGLLKITGAIDCKTGRQLLPLRKFRVRFK